MELVIARGPFVAITKFVIVSELQSFTERKSNNSILLLSSLRNPFQLVSVLLVSETRLLMPDPRFDLVSDFKLSFL